MNWQFTPYAVPLFVGGALVLGIAALAWHQRRQRGAIYLFWLCLALAFYMLGYAGELGSTTAADVQTWLKVEYLGVPFSSTLFFMLALVYSGRERYLTPLNFLLLLAVPVMTVVLAWTNEAHELLWQAIYLDRSGGFTATLFIRAPWNWLQTIYTFILTTLSGLLFLRALPHAEGLYRRQVMLFLAGIGIVVGGHLAYIAGWGPPGLDLSPFTFAIGGVMMALGILQVQLFDIMPVAHEVVLAGMRDGVVVIDQRGRVVEINPAAQVLLDMPRASTIGRPARDALPAALQALDDTAAEREYVASESGPDEAQRYFEVSHYPLYSKRGSSAGRVLVLRDFTERNQADTERERLISELDAFSHTVAHDLKNPLHTVRGYTDLIRADLQKLERNPELAALLRPTIKAATELSHATDKMGDIIDELLVLAGVRRGNVTPRPLDMAVIVAEAMSRLTYLIAEHEAEIEVTRAWPVALGHAPWVEEVWTNYLSNAIKYGGRPPRVEVGASALANGCVSFWVRDNGPGLTPAEQGHLFAPFERLDTVRAEGHGLGLSIVRRIVEKLDGQVGVESTPGAGCTFTFTLPAAPRGETVISG
ncbi:MAG: PAS domain-containing protein [Anaerolineae bacterium]|nr:PAS domain-containing protein [Anaerolineae bacterium]